VKISEGESGIRKQEGIEGEAGSRRQEDVRRGSRKQKALRYYKGKEEAEGLKICIRRGSRKQKARYEEGKKQSGGKRC
jgi:hypothetical protein